MEEDNRVFPFFNEEEVRQNTFIMMLMAQNELFKRLNEVNSDKPQLTKDEFFILIQSSPFFQDMLRDAVISAVKLTDWEKCHDIAAANSSKRELDENNFRRDNIKFV